MVAIAELDGMPAPILPARRARTLMIVSAGTGIALALALGGFVARGGGLNGTRYGAALVLAASSLAFVVAYIAQPLCRLVPLPATRALSRERVGLMQAFACMYAVFLACIALPDFLMGGQVPLPTLAFAIFSTLILAVMLFGTSAKRILGSSAGRTILGLSITYFWCAFVVNDLNHLVGPHRADLFDLSYQLSLVLLVLALLVRFAGAIVERRKVRMAEAL
jgi:hypothetical protein